MLSNCLKQATQNSTGRVYIKDAIAANCGKSLSVINNSTTNAQQDEHNKPCTELNSTQNYSTITPQSESQQNISNLGIIPNNSNDILNSILQSIGVQVSIFIFNQFSVIFLTIIIFF